MDTTRAYLIVPQLIEQPTWGGTYIATFKGWQNQPSLKDKRIGQSYELFHGSHLSLLKNSQDPDFGNQLETNTNKFPLSELVSPQNMHVLIKFTQALGNSFQLHIKDGQSHPFWKSKPESWYFFEPGYITLGAKENVDWNAYQTAVTQLQTEIAAITENVKANRMSLTDAKESSKQLVKKYNPWQFVNALTVPKETVIDLSACGIHHSWEEDTNQFPLGNVVYEVQVDVADDVSTLRNFDKGNITPDGSSRPLHIEEYFQLIDRKPSANNPQTHIKSPQLLSHTLTCTHQRLFQTKYYTLEKVLLNHDIFSQEINHFHHLFVKKGSIAVQTAAHQLVVSQGHSAFVPQTAAKYIIQSDEESEILISY